MGAPSSELDQPNGRGRPAARAVLAAWAFVGIARSAAAQAPAPGPAAAAARSPGADTGWALVGIGSVADAAARDSQLVGAAPAGGRLFRSPSTAPGADRLAEAGVRAILPQARVVWNGAVPFAANEGALWTGRGANVRLRGGVALREGRVRVVLAPELAYSANRGFDLRPSNVPGRSPYASPFYTGTPAGGPSADLPLRYGDRAFTNFDLGQSSLSVDAGSFVVGATSEAEWWGPGTRTALLLGNASAGVPRVFIRTRRPVRTPLGRLEARWFGGTLTKSPFFDDVPAHTSRSLAGVAASLEPRGVPGLTVGVARLVARPARDAISGATRIFDAFGYWEPAPRLSEVAPTTPGGAAAPQTRADQLFALSARQVLPAAGVEVYAEWARQHVPRSLREFLLTPHESQAYTVGLQWLSDPVAPPLPAAARRALGPARVRLGAEASNLEQTAALADRVSRDFYTGSSNALGMTQRGRPLGAFTGPGSQSQWLWAALAAPRWEAGTSAGRVRWNNDAFYREPSTNFFRHDVSLLAGAYAVVRRAAGDLRLEAAYQTRYNFLFQNGRNNPGGTRTIDVHNVTLGFELTPR